MLEQNRPWSIQWPIRSMKGCYTVQYSDDFRDGGPGWFPLRLLEGEWRAYFMVGCFELIVLRFPTYQEALDYIYSQA